MRAGPWRQVGGAGALVVAGLLAAQCGGGEPPIRLPPGNPDGGLDLSGYAVKGPISGGTVTAYRLLADMSRGEQLATTHSDSSGFFGLSLPAFTGDILLVVNGGTYLEEALVDADAGVPGPTLTVNVDFVGIVLEYQAGQPATANITPISHLAYSLARFHVRNLGEPVAKAVTDAFKHLGSHFGNVPGVATDLDWRTLVPSALGAGDGAQLTAAQRAALVLAGLSEVAATISSRAAISPGGPVNALSLLTALAEDLEADGVFDGLGMGGRQLLLPAGGSLHTTGPTATALDGSTVRIALASAIATYVRSSSNTSSITIPDVGAVTGAISADADTYLFKSPGTPFDVTPPKLTVVSAPPPYTNQSTVSLSVAAEGGPNSTGVKLVIAKTGDGTELTGANTNGNVWTFSNVLAGGTHPYFEIWAVDNANNSGEQFPVGDYHLRLPCLQDQIAPTIVQDFSVPSYLDERAMQLASNAVPAYFTWPAGLPRAVGPGLEAAIWKTSIRLSWGTAQPTGASLENPNSNNVPFIQIGIPFDATTDAPIASVTYSIAVQGGATSAGSLIPAQKMPEGSVYYYLPLATETIPGLAYASTSPVVFAVSVTATDAAGNSTTNQLESSTANSFSFHIIGPPLYVAQDTGYPDAGDAKSIFPFALANGTYPGKFAGNNGGEIARQARFIVYNPYPVAVPFSTAVPSYVTTGSEEWDDSVWMAGNVVWDVTSLCDVGPPCDPQSAQPQPYIATLGGTAFACEAPNSPRSHSDPPTAVFTSPTGQLSVWQFGAEGTQPGGYSDRVVVPAAQGSTAGAVVVYAGRPWSSFGLPPYAFGTDSNPDGVSRFYRFIQDFWQRGASQGTVTCNCTAPPPVCQHGMLYQYPQLRWTNVLSAASESFTGTWTYQSYSPLTPTTDLGDGAPRSIDVSGNATY